MEEFRSTEILDKEIQEDARRKAEKLLKRADEDCQKIMDELAARIEAVSKEKQAFYAARAEAIKKDLGAALPLEKERFLVSFIDSSILKGIYRFIDGLSSEKKIALLENLLKRYESKLADKKLTVKFHGFEQDELKKMFQKHFNKLNIDSFVSLNDDAAKELHDEYGMIIESTDKSVRCRVTIDELIEEIVDTYRYEIAEALFGGRINQ
ncbi:MAG: hypothetical protein J5798_09910 [Spirochaetaceae bacterium]|nr:hypothetical protein [Spirochaetaceae bacterium]